MQTDSRRLFVGRMPLAPWMVAFAWGLLSFTGFVATFSVLVWPLGQLQSAGVPHVVVLGLWALGWVPVSGLLGLLAARLLFGTWPAVHSFAWLLLLTGAVVSGAHSSLLSDWAIGRYGYGDPDFIGPTSLLFAVVAGVAVAGFGVQIAPRWAVWTPLLALLGGLVLGAFILIENIPGLSDGLGSDSGPLAAATVAAAAYIGAVGIVSLIRLRGG